MSLSKRAFGTSSRTWWRHAKYNSLLPPMDGLLDEHRGTDVPTRIGASGVGAPGAHFINYFPFR